MMPVRLEPAASRSQVKHSTTEPLLSLKPEEESISIQRLKCETHVLTFLLILCTINFLYTVKYVLSSNSKIDKIKVSKPCGSLMQIKSTAECKEHSAMLLTCIKRLSIS